MAKKKAGERSPKNKERKDIGRFGVVGVRASLKWIAWLRRGAKACGLSAAVVLARGAALYLAEKENFKEVPPDRIP